MFVDNAVFRDIYTGIKMTQITREYSTDSSAIPIGIPITKDEEISILFSEFTIWITENIPPETKAVRQTVFTADIHFLY